MPSPYNKNLLCETISNFLQCYSTITNGKTILLNSKEAKGCSLSILEEDVVQCADVTPP